MEKVLGKLPPQLQQELRRWYTISGVAIMAALLLMSAIHIWTTLQLHHMPPIVEQQPTTIPIDEDVLQQQSAELQTLLKKQKGFFDILVPCINAMPDSMHFTKLVIEPDKYLECMGSAPNQSAIAEFIHTLKQEGLSCSCIDIRNEQEPSQTLTFRVTFKA